MAFPVVDAFLLCPEEGKSGKVAVCTNMLAPGMVSNEIPFELRSDVAVMGSLVVNRDGAERMIINALAHPSLEYVILFGQETLSFCPSTNLLQALMNGYKADKPGNVINGGRGVAHQYPSISPKLLEMFRSRFKVLPLFNHQGQSEVITKYIDWLKPKLSQDIFDLIVKIRAKKEIYYDSLAELIALLQKTKPSSVSAVQLDPKDFQHLQPPIVELVDSHAVSDVSFQVRAAGEEIACDIDLPAGQFTIQGSDSFLMAYSLMLFLNEKQVTLSVKDQLLLGVDLSRIEMQLRNGVVVPSLVKSNCKTGVRTQIEFKPQAVLKADKLYYYKIGVRDGKLSVQSLAHDTCTSVFELRAKSIYPIIDRLAAENRFESYEQEFLHRVDVGIEAGRAAIALHAGYSYFQDFRSLFKVNTDDFPVLQAQGDSFLGVHQKIITALYTRGLTAPHADAHKGTMRAGTVLAVYRNTPASLKHFPELYASGALTASQMRKEYEEQLSSKEPVGEYTYGSRTRAHFGYDQRESAITALKQNPNQTVIVQRFDFIEDMNLKETEVKDAAGKVIRTRLEATKDPCLTHDIYFIQDNKLHAFHMARAHNIVNAYPENIFGLHDSYDSFIAKELNLPLGDLFMLSSRANILLLTEEQKAKKLIAEPAKPPLPQDESAGPVDLRYQFPARGIASLSQPLEETAAKPIHPCLTALENYRGVNLVEKAASYLKRRGGMHNNPLFGSYDPRTRKQTDAERLIFFQCNVAGGKLQATAVFADGTKSMLAKDVQLCNYLATQFKNALDLPLGNLSFFYVPVR